MKLSVIIPGFGTQRTMAEANAERVRVALPDAQVIVADGTNVAVARNNGLVAAEGEWLMWVDADDELLLKPEDIEAAMRLNADVVVWDYERVEETKRMVRRWGRTDPSVDDYARDVLGDLRLGSYLWGRLWRRSVFDGLRFDTSLVALEDYLLQPQILAKLHRVAYIPKVGYRYFFGGGSLTTALDYGALSRAFKESRDRIETLPENWRRSASVGAAVMATYIIIRKVYHRFAVAEEDFKAALDLIDSQRWQLLTSSSIPCAWKVRFAIHIFRLWHLRQRFR